MSGPALVQTHSNPQADGAVPETPASIIRNVLTVLLAEHAFQTQSARSPKEASVHLDAETFAMVVDRLETAAGIDEGERRAEDRREAEISAYYGDLGLGGGL